MYVQDYDENYPPAMSGAYVELLNPYLKNIDLWRCPVASGILNVSPCYDVGGAPGCEKYTLLRIASGRLVNADLLGGYDGTPMRTEASITAPAEVVALAESHVWGSNDEDVYASSYSVTQTTYPLVSACRNILDVRISADEKANSVMQWPFGRGGESGSRLGARHAGGMNLAFADGHCKYSSSPPEDCSAWVTELPKGTVAINSTLTGGCRPPGQARDWCIRFKPPKKTASKKNR